MFKYVLIGLLLMVSCTTNTVTNVSEDSDNLYKVYLKNTVLLNARVFPDEITMPFKNYSGFCRTVMAGMNIDSNTCVTITKIFVPPSDSFNWGSDIVLDSINGDTLILNFRAKIRQYSQTIDTSAQSYAKADSIGRSLFNQSWAMILIQRAKSL